MACPLPVGRPAPASRTPPRADNIVLYAAIVLVPLGMAVLFIRLGRIFSSR